MDFASFNVLAGCPCHICGRGAPPPLGMSERRATRQPPEPFPGSRRHCPASAGRKEVVMYNRLLQPPVADLLAPPRDPFGERS